MTTLTLSRKRADVAVPMSANPIAPSQGIRDLLRGSALLVTTLSSGGTTQDFRTLRDLCTKLVKAFDTALTQRGLPRDVRDDAIVAQCALLDETALRHLDTENKNQWVAQPLQVERLKHHNAGEYLFERLEFRMRESAPNADLLECYAAILGLGFRGRYALEGDTKRDALIAGLNAQLSQLRPESPSPFLVDHTARGFGNWFHRLSPWGIAGLAAIAALVVWLVWHVALDAQLAASIPKAVKP